MAPHLRRGYPTVKIAGAIRLVHRLVLETFVGACPVGHEASHLNGVRSDSRLVNLAWETRSQNALRRTEHGTATTGDRHWTHRFPERMQTGERHISKRHPERVLRGEAHPRAKLTVEDVRAIRAASERGETATAIAARYPVNRTAISAIVRRALWRFV